MCDSERTAIQEGQVIYFFLAASSSSFCQVVRSKRTLIVKKATDLLSADLADTSVPRLGAGLAKGAVGFELTLFGGDFAGSLSGIDVRDSNRSTGGGGGKVVALSLL